MAIKRLALPLLALLLAAGPASSAPARQHRVADENVMRAAESRAMALRQALGLSEQYSFRAFNSHEDELGQNHVRMDLLYNGVRVLGGDAILHTEGDTFRACSAGDFTETFYRDITLSTQPSLSATEAQALAAQDMAIRHEFAVDPKVELVILPLTENVVRPESRQLPADRLNALDMESVVIGHKLAYEVVLYAENEEDGIQEMLYHVDAQTGEILEKYDNLKTDGRAVGKGNSQHNGQVEIETNKAGSGYEMRDMTRGQGGNCTYDLANGSENTSSKGKIFTDNDNNWGDGKNYTHSNSTSANGQTAAVDAHYGMAVSWDFYKNVLGRNGINGKNTASYSRVHAGRKWDNACWGAAGCFCMTYGDGNSFKVLTSIDVVGHELSHGVCGSSCNLVYKGESGGLNEANSDIGGTMVEFYAGGGGFKAKSKAVPDKGGNWDIGEKLSSKPMRWMHKPSKDGKSPDAWKSNIGGIDVHYSSGPGNRMFYFLSQGATTSGETAATQYLPKGMKGIGNDKATRIWFRALFTYFKSNTDYKAAREGVIKAAVDLYKKGSAEEAAVHNAFAGINVGKPWPGTSPDPTPNPDPTPDPDPTPEPPKPPAPKPPKPKPPTPKPPKPPAPKPPAPDPSPDPTPDPTPDPNPDPGSGGITDPDMSRIKAMVNFLCNDQCAGRLTGSEGERVAGNHIAEQFKKLGLQGLKSGGSPTPYHQGWQYKGYADHNFFTANGIAESANAWWQNDEAFTRGTAYNIGGILPGTDARLKNEYIVVTGHYDHLGKAKGGICRGADDNASGTTGVVEIATCLKNFQPKRSIIFLAVSGEEKGLLGSGAFVKDCPVPVSSIKGNINLDMIGRNADGILHVAPAKQDGKVSTLVRDARSAAKGVGIQLSGGMDSYMGSSDQASFVKKNIPAIFFITGLHDDYHTPRDTPDKLNWNKMLKAIQIARDVVVKAANETEPPKVLPKSEWSKWDWKKSYFNTEDYPPIIGGPRVE